MNEIVVFDFDGTLTTDEKHRKEYYDGNAETIADHQRHREEGTPTLLLTARPTESLMATKVNCRMLGIYPSRIRVNSENKGYSFKKEVRSELSKHYKITHNYGNNPWDFAGSEAGTNIISIDKDGVRHVSRV